MPSPGSKSKPKKSKPSESSISASSIGGAPESFIGDIDNAVDWYIFVEIMCKTLNIPGTRLLPHTPVIPISDISTMTDLATRSGLKKVYADFQNIYQLLNGLYNKYPRNEKLSEGWLASTLKCLQIRFCEISCFKKVLEQESNLSLILHLQVSSLN